MFGFIVGAVAGSVAAYMWHERIQQYMNNDVSSFRDRAADRLGVLGKAAASSLDRARTSLESTVRTGQEKLRSTGTDNKPQSPQSSYSGGRQPGG